jgi:hypothetical protein
VGGACGTHGREVCRALMGTSEVKKPLSRPRRKCEKALRMDLGENRWVGGGGGLWIGLIWLRTGSDGGRWLMR